jgi:membrane fusion protein, multidrug efflux system
MKNNIIYLLGLVLVLASCGNKEENKLETLEKLKKQQAELNAQIKQLEAELAGTLENKQKIKFVSVQQLQASTFMHYLDVYGKIVTDDNILLSARMPGTVKRIMVKAGDKVSKGQTLAMLDNETILAGMEEAKTRLALVTTVYEKQKALWDEKIGTEIQFITAKNNKEQVEKAIASLNEQLEMTYIKSPIDGTVDEVFMKLGEATAPGAPAIRVVSISALKVRAEVAESYASRIKEGNEVIIRLPDVNKEITATVSFVGKVINEMNRTFSIEVKLPSDADLQPNMLAVLSIIDYKKENSIIVPVNIIQNSEEGQYLMVAESKNGGKTAGKRMIKAGLNYDGKAEVFSGLAEGDLIITTGYQDLNQGDLLKF